MTPANRPQRVGQLPGARDVADALPEEYSKYWDQKEQRNLDGPAPEQGFSCNLDTIRKLALDHLDPELFRDAKVEWFSRGSYNHLFSITSTRTSKEYLMRISEPYDPFFKTESEVATMEYIRAHTSLPVPAITAYSSTMSNELGFEWILMEKMNGVTYYDVREKIPLESKMKLVEDLANGMAPIIKEGVFPAFGSLYFDDIRNDIGKSTDIGGDFIIGPMTSTRFRRERRDMSSPDRGPFNTSQELLMAEFDLVSKRIRNTAPAGEFQFDLGPDREVLGSLDRLQNMLPFLAPAVDGAEDAKVLWHGDLNVRNILVDPQTFQLVGAIDWEMTDIVPAWETDGFTPTFLLGRDVNEKPVRRAGEDSKNLNYRIGEWEDTLGRRRWSEIMAGIQSPALVSGSKNHFKAEIRDCIACIETDLEFSMEWIDEQEKKMKA